MRVIRKYNDDIKEVNYPRKDNEPIADLDKNIQYYLITEHERPAYDPNKSRIETKDILTETKHPEYPWFLICDRVWEIIDYPKQTVIAKLNNSVGDHLDSAFDYAAKRDKHTAELLGLHGVITEARRAYLQSLKDWEKRCREERTNREIEYIDNNIFPSFVWEAKPEKL